MPPIATGEGSDRSVSARAIGSAVARARGHAWPAAGLGTNRAADCGAPASRGTALAADRTGRAVARGTVRAAVRDAERATAHVGVSRDGTSRDGTACRAADWGSDRDAIDCGTGVAGHASAFTTGKIPAQ